MNGKTEPTAWGPIIISTIATLAFASVVLLLITRPPSGTSEVLTLLIGALSGGYLQTLNYWFGSSAGSKRKDDMIKGMSDNATDLAKTANVTSVSGGPTTIVSPAPVP